MKSTKCPACGFVGWSDGPNCKQCGAALATSFPSPQPWTGSAPGNLKKGLAVASLVLGIISFFTLGILGVGAVVGLILGVIALTRVNRQPTEYGGKGLAIAGIVLSVSSFAMAVPIGIIAAIAVPNLLAARRAANEAVTLSSLRQIVEAQSSHQTIRMQFGTLEELASEQLISPELATGTKSGYKYKLSLTTNEETGEPGFEVWAMPESYPNSGRRSFYVNETGVIRAADAQGSEATRHDPPLDFDNDYTGGSSPSYSYDRTIQD